jgi:hypothetical protein
MLILITLLFGFSASAGFSQRLAFWLLQPSPFGAQQNRGRDSATPVRRLED